MKTVLENYGKRSKFLWPPVLGWGNVLMKSAERTLAGTHTDIKLYRKVTWSQWNWMRLNSSAKMGRFLCLLVYASWCASFTSSFQLCETRPQVLYRTFNQALYWIQSHSMHRWEEDVVHAGRLVQESSVRAQLYRGMCVWLAGNTRPNHVPNLLNGGNYHILSKSIEWSPFLCLTISLDCLMTIA